MLGVSKVAYFCGAVLILSICSNLPDSHLQHIGSGLSPHGHHIAATLHLSHSHVTVLEGRQAGEFLHVSLKHFFFSFEVSDQIRSVAQSCPTLFNPMNRSTPGLPVHHQLLEFTQTHVHRVSDAIQPSHPLSSSSPPAPNPAQHQSLFQ